MKNATEEKLYDFHQRKGKEIRRRQYSAWLREKNNVNVKENYPINQKFERILTALGGMFRTSMNKTKFVKIGERFLHSWQLVSIGGLFRTETGEYEYVIIPREILLDLEDNVNESLLGFGIFYESDDHDEGWIKVDNSSTEKGSV